MNFETSSYMQAQQLSKADACAAALPSAMAGWQASGPSIGLSGFSVNDKGSIVAELRDDTGLKGTKVWKPEEAADLLIEQATFSVGGSLTNPRINVKVSGKVASPNACVFGVQAGDSATFGVRLSGTGHFAVDGLVGAGTSCD